MNKEQEKFWDLLKNPYPPKSKQGCINCKHCNGDECFDRSCSHPIGALQCFARDHPIGNKRTNEKSYWEWEHS